MSVDYQMDDCVLALPEGFIDRTTNVFEWKTSSGDSVVLVVQREPFPEHMEFDEYVADQTSSYPAKFDGFRLERDERGDERLAGVKIHRKAFRWKTKDGVVYNHQVFLLDAPRVLVMTASGNARHRAEVDALTDEALAGLRLRDA